MNNKYYWTLYVLKLEQGKYYVGITSKSAQERLWEHQHKVRAAYWTMKYEPKEIILTKELGLITKEEAEKQENQAVREYLKKYGVNNVRGGDLTQTDDLVIRFGYIWDKLGWETVITIVMMMLVVVVLIAKLYHWL